MIGFLITGHDDFPTGLKASLSMIAGEQEKLAAVPFKENMSLEDFGNQLKEAVKQVNQDGEGVLIFSDLLGGTPFRTAMLVASEFEEVEVLTGTNLPMLLEASSLRFSQTNVETLARAAIDIGAEGIQNPKLDVLEETEKTEDPTEEGI